MADSHSLSLPPDHSPPSDLRLCNSAERDAISPSGSGGWSSSARYKLLSPAKLPISRSPCISLPTGISPTSLLESPVLLSNMKAEPSPTTGSFMNPQPWHGGSPGFSLAANCSKNDTVDERRNDSFEFIPHPSTDSVRGLPPSQPFGSANTITNEVASSTNESILPSPGHQLAIVPAVVDSEDMNQRMALTSGLKASKSDHKDIGHSITAERSSDDGYNWRKYGQKLVKGCEFPRSYYKCTHPNCEVKKIFERSYEGKTTEIVYKGSHDHPKPLPARRFAAGAIMSVQEQTDHVLSLASGEDKSAMCCLNSHYNDPNGTPQLSPCGTNDNCLEGSIQLNGNNEEGDEEDPFSKRRKDASDITPLSFSL